MLRMKLETLQITKRKPMFLPWSLTCAPSSLIMHGCVLAGTLACYFALVVFMMCNALALVRVLYSAL